MSESNWRIPASTLENLQRVPQNKPVALLLRHSVRDAIAKGDPGNLVPITPDGERLAAEFGRILKGRIRQIRSSPVLRCRQTAEQLNQASAANLEITEDVLLGEPGVFVTNGELAWPNWQRLGHEGVVRHLIESTEALPGMADPDEAAQILLRHVLQAMGDGPGLHVFVTHDIVVMVTIARLLRRKLGMEDWPRFLEGAFLWTDDAGVRFTYRDTEAFRDFV